MFTLKKANVCLCLFLATFATLTANAGETVVFAGVKHTALGNAQLKLTGDSLQVTNLGEAGNDGVSVHAGEIQALTTTVAQLDPSVLEDGAGLTATVIGQVNGLPGITISNLSMTDLGPDIILWCKWLANAAKEGMTATAEISLGGEVVAVIPDLQGPIARICDPIRFPRIDPIWPIRPVNPNDIFMMVTIGEPVPAYLPQLDKTVMADSFTVKLTGTGARIDNVSEVQYTAQKMAALDIVNQEIAMNNLLHTTEGAVEANAVSGNLNFTGFTPDGSGGFTVDLTGKRYYYAQIAPLCLDADGAGIYFESTGSMNGQRGVFLGSASLENRDGSLYLSADYSAIGSNQVQVYLVNGSKIIGKPILPNGLLGRIPNPSRVGGCGKWDPIPPLPCYILDFDRLTTIQLANGRTYEVTGLRVITTETGTTLDSLDTFTARATGIQSLMLLNEAGQAPQKNIRFKK